MVMAAPLAIPAAEAIWAGLGALAVGLGLVAAKKAADGDFSRAPATTCQGCAAAGGAPPPPDDPGCFEPPRGSNATEFERQLKEQQDALNQLSPDEYLRRRAGYSGAIRDRAAQALARNQEIARRVPGLVRRYLRPGTTIDQARSLAEAEARRSISRLDATHVLDMIAGGDPSAISGLGDSSINRSIGSQWRSRVGALDRAARAAKARGQKLMNVLLKKC